jgi:uncharacterized protein
MQSTLFGIDLLIDAKMLALQGLLIYYAGSMKFLVKELEEGTHEISLRGKLDPELDRNACQFPQTILVTLRSHRFEDNVHVDIFYETQAQLTCHRCLQDFSLPVKDKTNLFFRFVEAGSHSDLEGEEGVVELREDSREYDLTSFISETLALSLPIKVLCRKDCRGLCADCGANLNEAECGCAEKRVDPRLQGLSAFLQRDK